MKEKTVWCQGALRYSMHIQNVLINVISYSTPSEWELGIFFKAHIMPIDMDLFHLRFRASDENPQCHGGFICQLFIQQCWTTNKQLQNIETYTIQACWETIPQGSGVFLLILQANVASAFFPDFLLKDVCRMNRLGYRDSISLRSKGWACLLSSIT